jgi:hypothetical protein
MPELQDHIVKSGGNFVSTLAAVLLAKPPQNIANEMLDRAAKPFVYGSLIFIGCTVLGEIFKS